MIQLLVIVVSLVIYHCCYYFKSIQYVQMALWPLFACGPALQMRQTSSPDTAVVLKTKKHLSVSFPFSFSLRPFSGALVTTGQTANQLSASVCSPLKPNSAKTADWLICCDITNFQKSWRLSFKYRLCVFLRGLRLWYYNSIDIEAKFALRSKIIPYRISQRMVARHLLGMLALCE